MIWQATAKAESAPFSLGTHWDVGTPCCSWAQESIHCSHLKDQWDWTSILIF